MSFKITLLSALLSVLSFSIHAQQVRLAENSIAKINTHHSDDFNLLHLSNAFASKKASTTSVENESNRIEKGWLKGNSSGTCSNWLYVNTNNGAVQIGDLDVPGTSITVEATFNRTQPRSQSDELYAGDLVSKHKDPINVNYLLRPNTAEITTDQGYFRTPDICDVELNKTYHVAMTYDGATLKFYRNGFLMSAVPAHGKLFQNDFITTIGNFAYEPGFGNEGLLGYINEVRIWNITRTQAELNTYLDKPLPNPAIQPGLVAYYTFDDLKNKQGNATWDGTLINGASINQSNPTCSNYVKDSCDIVLNPLPEVIPFFTLPDTVCVNTPVHLTNTTIGASNYYWSFCTADLKNTVPIGDNLGNIGGALSQPVFMDLVSDNGKYYAFLTNHYPGGLVRLDFGNSYLNTPTATSFGNFGGIIPSGYGTEGIQVVKNEGKWYAIIVAGSPANGVASRVIKIEFGTSIENPSPVATNWGNIGEESLPIDFYMFKDQDQWYGFTVNANDNTITRIAFSNSFDNIPTGTNLGNVGNLLSYPTGVHAINNEGSWSLFITNSGTNKLVRLDFGNSLLNTPVAKNLGNVGNLLNEPRDLTIIKSCESIIGYIVNRNGSNIVQIDFDNNVNNTPTGKTLGNIGSLGFPHSISKLFRVNNDLYSFITNVDNNTVTRLKFNGCNNSNIAGSLLQNPPDISYNKAGIYNITLSVDEGLATQTSTCRQVVVMAPPKAAPILDTLFCAGGSITLVSSISTGSNYNWNTGATTNNIKVSNSGKYWVTTDVYGCKSTDSFNVSKVISPMVSLGNDTALCKGDSLILYAKNLGSTYLWQDGSSADSLKINQKGLYSVEVTNIQGCSGMDTINISSLLPPVISGLQDQTICRNDVARLSLTADGNNSFNWQQDATLSATNIANPSATPDDTTRYYITVKNENGCVKKDSVNVNVLARPKVSVRADTIVCQGDTVKLSTSTANATIFSWSPLQNLSNHNSLSPVATPTYTTTYSITAGNGVCEAVDEITINVKQLPSLDISNDTTVCGASSIQLFATGAQAYSWFPASGLNDASAQNPVASPTHTILYYVKATGENGCVNKDSVKISVEPLPNFSITPSQSEVCLGDSILISASGGDVYSWYASPDILQPDKAATYIKPSADGIYKVFVSNNTCKLKDTLYTTLRISQKPVIHVSYSNDIDCAVNSAILTATGANNYEWTPASTLNNPYSSSPVATPIQTTVYHVKATGEKVCATEDSVTVKVSIANLENGYQIPSAFTPNNDGINDCFGLKKWSTVDNVEFSIYNRWGALIFHGKNIADCWDGTYKSIPQTTGVYIYTVKAKTFCGNIYKKGTVVLIR